MKEIEIERVHAEHEKQNISAIERNGLVVLSEPVSVPILINLRIPFIYAKERGEELMSLLNFSG